MIKVQSQWCWIWSTNEILFKFNDVQGDWPYVERICDNGWIVFERNSSNSARYRCSLSNRDSRIYRREKHHSTANRSFNRTVSRCWCISVHCCDEILWVDGVESKEIKLIFLIFISFHLRVLQLNIPHDTQSAALILNYLIRINEEEHHLPWW